MGECFPPAWRHAEDLPSLLQPIDGLQIVHGGLPCGAAGQEEVDHDRVEDQRKARTAEDPIAHEHEPEAEIDAPFLQLGPMAGAPLRVLVPRLARPPLPEHGSASCKDRVVQYVYITRVAAAL